MYLIKQNKITFPKSKGININMMPFAIGDTNSIPDEYKGYSDIIDSCKVHPSELGKVGYLTITETRIEANTSQRRGGVHTEKHPLLNWGGGGGSWGGSKGGLFMANTIDESCAAWNQYIETPGLMGDCEHLRDSLKNEVLFSANTIYWLTDGTPHESMPVSEDCNRQYFRLVTSDVSVWYEKHSTANVLGVQPDCKVIKEDKFN